MQHALEPAVFDPTASDRRFAPALNNYAAVVLAPPVVAAVSAAAPAVYLDLRPSGTLDVVDRLHRCDLDLVLASTQHPGEHFTTEPLLELLEDPFVMVMRHGHPASRSKLTAAKCAALSHLEISSSREDASFIDSWLGEQGLARRIALRAPYLSAASIIAQSDLVRESKLSERTSLCGTTPHWLVAHDLGRFRPDGNFEVRPSTFTQLRQRELRRVGEEVTTRIGATYTPVVTGQEIQGRIGETIEAPGGKIVVVHRGADFTVVPWSRRLEQLRGREIAGVVATNELMIGPTRGRMGPQR
jgi:DNA-binding transcriptional LysR family regulator